MEKRKKEGRKKEERYAEEGRRERKTYSNKLMQILRDIYVLDRI